MKFSSFIAATVIPLALLLPMSVFSQQQSADILTAASGTYSYTFFGNTPFANLTKKTVVINGANDTMCIDGHVLSNPYSKPLSNGAALAIFSDTQTGILYGFGLATSPVQAVNVYVGTDAAVSGQLSGKLTSTSTNCSGGVTPLSLSSAAESVFALALEVYPDLFKNGTELGETQGYIYRYFADSKIYVGIKDESVFLVGGIFGDKIVNKGSISAVTSALQTAKINIQNAINTGNPGTGTGNNLYNLTISGKFVTPFININIPNITVPNLPAPSPTDTTAFSTAVQSLGASNISGLTVQTLNNTASRVTFRVQFTALLTGFGSVNYDLTYDYNK